MNQTPPRWHVLAAIAAKIDALAERDYDGFMSLVAEAAALRAELEKEGAEIVSSNRSTDPRALLAVRTVFLTFHATTWMVWHDVEGSAVQWARCRDTVERCRKLVLDLHRRVQDAEDEAAPYYQAIGELRVLLDDPGPSSSPRELVARIRAALTGSY